MGTTVAGGDEYLEPILIDLRCLAILYGALLCVVIILLLSVFEDLRRGCKRRFGVLSLPFEGQDSF